MGALVSLIRYADDKAVVATSQRWTVLIKYQKNTI